MRASTPSTRSGNNNVVRTLHPHTTTSRRTVARPQASVCDRIVFRKSLDHKSKHCDDSAVKSDSDPAYSEDNESDDQNEDGGDGDTERHPPRSFARPAH